MPSSSRQPAPAKPPSGAIPPLPAGARATLSADPATRTAVIRWKAVGGPGVTILLLLMLSPFAAVTTFMTVVAFAKAATTNPFLIAFVVLMALSIWLLVLLVIDAQRHWHQTLTITPDHVIGRLEGGLFGGLIGSLRRWELPVASVRNVRVHDDDNIEFSCPGPNRRMIVHLPAPGEPEWIAGAARVIIGV